MSETLNNFQDIEKTAAVVAESVGKMSDSVVSAMKNFAQAVDGVGENLSAATEYSSEIIVFAAALGALSAIGDNKTYNALMRDAVTEAV